MMWWALLNWTVLYFYHHSVHILRNGAWGNMRGTEPFLFHVRHRQTMSVLSAHNHDAYQLQ